MATARAAKARLRVDRDGPLRGRRHRLSATVSVGGGVMEATVWNAAKGLEGDGTIRLRVGVADWPDVRNLLLKTVDEALAEWWHTALAALPASPHSPTSTDKET